MNAYFTGPCDGKINFFQIRSPLFNLFQQPAVQNQAAVAAQEAGLVDDCAATPASLCR